MNICICGGGSLGHVIAGFAASHDVNVSVLTRSPEKWNKELIIDDCKGVVYRGTLSVVTDNPEDVIPNAQLVLLCLPGFAIENVLKQIQSYLSPETLVGSVVSSTGFFFMAYKTFGKNTPLFGFQRAPFIARVNKYGESAHLLGYKKELQVATSSISDKSSLQKTLQLLLDTPVRILDNFWEASLTNSNPLLHPVRLYGLFHDWAEGKIYSEPIGFYNSWDDYSSELLIACDEEFHKILSELPVEIEQIPTILDYYESKDAPSLTRKIKSIEAFKGILTPMLAVKEGGYIPNFESRYFREDFPFGLLIIKSFAEILQIKTPSIDKVLLWGQKMIHKDYMINGCLRGNDLENTGYVSKELFRELMR